MKYKWRLCKKCGNKGLGGDSCLLCGTPHKKKDMRDNEITIMRDNEKKLELISINFQQAQILGEDGEDIVVFEPSSGQVFRFDEEVWPSHLSKSAGMLEMDDHYEFVWFRYR